ncbi:MAG: hypothetical protein LAN37_08165 [Acidobacteriia bacterium]|nr:hypothetical protein [Terriglobia bacterium]
MTSRRTKLLGLLAAICFVLFAALETEGGQRILRDYFDIPFDPDDLLHGTGIGPAVVFFVPGLLLAIGTAISKAADNRHAHRR